MHLVGARYVIVHDLEIQNQTSNGVNADDGDDRANIDASRYLVFRNLSIHDIGAGGKANIAVEKIPQEMLFITVRSAEPRHWLQAIDFLASRKKAYPFEDMISKSYTLDQINEAMQAMANYSVVKAVINL